MNGPVESSRLMLQLERALLARTYLRERLTAADAAVAGCRRDLRNLRARLARTRVRSLPGHSA